MQKIIVIVVCLFLCGCASTRMGDVASANRSNLVKLSLDMSKQEAMEAMGKESRTASCWFARVSIGNPYKSEILKSRGMAFEVLYYFTDPNEVDCDIGTDNLTPLIFVDGKLIGWGKPYLDDIRMRYGIMPSF